MDAASASPPAARRFWKVTPAVEVMVLAVAAVIAVSSYYVIEGSASPQRLLTPPLVALLLVANLVPGVVLLVLLGRRIARRRAVGSPIGGNGRLHVRLVALFSLLASVPMILVTIFASLLFQYGVEFWFSDRARGMLENAAVIANDSAAQMRNRVAAETETMAGDLRDYLAQAPIDSQAFAAGFGSQVYHRELSEAAIFSVTARNGIQTQALVNPYERRLEDKISLADVTRLRGGEQSIATDTGDRIQALTAIPGSRDLFLYAARVADPKMLAQAKRAESVLADYRALQARSRTLQLQFNAALLVVSLLIVGIAVFIALAVADRLVRPVSELVDAAHKVAEGDLAARVADPSRDDEIGTLARAFNQMTGRLEEQTGALESRRALLEAVMGGVSAGIISIGSDRAIRVMNRSARALLHADEESPFGRPLHEISPELDAMLDDGAREDIVEVAIGADTRTLAVRIARADGGAILTFDDITQQQLDQRRAAWADVARRIAHEIKNPLTPIQLAAERLQRRYGKIVPEGDGTFARLTDTIVRQVGDLRRMVDEFSSFARMPKPVFRPESVLDIARQALFLHEVAHPGIAFTLDHDDTLPQLVCDRRQLGQALTNIVKNAVEAIEARPGDGKVAMRVAAVGGRVIVAVADNGVGLPADRDRIVEPYMTTRARGTGLGLAIVKKIVEEHFGTMTFSDNDGGGTLVTLSFDANALAALDDAREPELAGEAG